MKKLNFKIDEINLVLIVAVVAIIFGVYQDRHNHPAFDAEKITGLLMDDHEISFAGGGVVNSNKLAEIQKMEYSQLKSYLKINNDFCMYLQDINGTIIISKGSKKLSDGVACR